MSAQPLDNIGIFFGLESLVGDFGGGKGSGHGFRVVKIDLSGNLNEREKDDCLRFYKLKPNRVLYGNLYDFSNSLLEHDLCI